MDRVITRCLLANLACVAACGALLFFYPRERGFTFTTSKVTHFISGGAFLSSLLMCLLNLAIGAYLAWSLLHPR